MSERDEMDFKDSRSSASLISQRVWEGTMKCSLFEVWNLDI